MTIKELECVASAIRHTKEVIAQLGCENYPFSQFDDEDIGEMFYSLNDMVMAIDGKIDVLERKKKK